MMSTTLAFYYVFQDKTAILKKFVSSHKVQVQDAQKTIESDLSVVFLMLNNIAVPISLITLISFISFRGICLFINFPKLRVRLPSFNFLYC